jgi:gluconate 2-dehydrogenase subunit 3-like protein
MMSNVKRCRFLLAAQRAKAKLTGYVNIFGIVAIYLVRQLIEFLQTKLGNFLAMLSREPSRELARRHLERSPQDGHWFTPDECALVRVLASLIVPSDETSPGADEVDILGPSAVDILDRLVACSRPRRALYGNGLVALDQLAQRKYKGSFAQSTQVQQLVLLRHVDRLSQVFSNRTSLIDKIESTVAIFYHKWSGQFPAAELFPILVRDVLQVFYTSQVSWIWLGYDGPPMLDGYPELRARHSSTLEVEANSE